jgi:RNA polymerase sigma-70 factor (ECF subfamily)
MTSEPATPDWQHCLDRLRTGDRAAVNELLRHTSGRLQRLARKMLHGFPALRRWEQTDDVLQNALLRLHRALAELRPESPRQFFGLAAAQLRRALLDLQRHYFGPEGAGARHATDGAATDDGPPRHEAADDTRDPARLAEWGELHRQAAALPAEEREVFDLLWYHGLTQANAAAVLQVTVRTVKRRWQAARLRLHAALRDGPPPSGRG